MIIFMMMEGGENGQFVWRKVVVVGDHGAGKTSLIKQFCEGKFFDRYQPTVGVDYGHKRCSVNGKEVDVTFWDLAGGLEFIETRKHLYSHTQICLIVCDARHFSQEKLQEWIKEITKYDVPLQYTAVLVNKMDDCTNTDLTEMLQKISSSLKMRANTFSTPERGQPPNGWFFHVSALTGEGVSDAFYSLLSDSINK